MTHCVSGVIMAERTLGIYCYVIWTSFYGQCPHVNSWSFTPNTSQIHSRGAHNGVAKSLQKDSAVKFQPSAEEEKHWVSKEINYLCILQPSRRVKMQLCCKGKLTLTARFRCWLSDSIGAKLHRYTYSAFYYWILCWWCSANLQKCDAWPLIWSANLRGRNNEAVIYGAEGPTTQLLTQDCDFILFVWGH